MKNREHWQPTKYVYRRGKLTASRSVGEVNAGSRLIADIVASYYDAHLRMHARGRLLDLGCGKVPLFIVYEKLVTESVCIDWGSSLHKNQHLDIEHDLTQPLPFPENSFDTILLSDVLEHLPEPARLWDEVARVLAPGGKIIMNVPFYYWLHEAPHDYFRYTKYALQRFSENVGMRVLYLESIGGAPEIIADIVSKNALRLPRFGRRIAILTQWMASVFLRTGFGRKVSTLTRADFPLGYFMVAQKESP
jgi:SAM-dependent methyltransferase